MLTEITRQLQLALREYDLLARWGGEEFLIVLPNTELKTAQHVGDRLRQLIESHPMIFEAQTIAVTLTLGVAIVGDSESCDSAIKRADEALYQGKNQGRNQVVAAD